ncbi:MAG: hypothetical protein ACUVTN_06665 [Thermodesulfobacteriota bacterium]
MGKILYIFFLLLILGNSNQTFSKEIHEEFPVPPLPLSEGIYPCSQCHATMELNIKKRILKDEHENIKLHHAETMRWCLDCHYSRNRDKLRLYNGELIDFDRSYLLCGECHGNVLRDWKAGIHGKRQGYFAGGKRTYLLCVHCHDAHSPRPKPIKPEPPPFRPREKRYAK